MSFIDYTTYGIDGTLVRYDCQTVCYRHHDVLLDLVCGDEAHCMRKRMGWRHAQGACPD